MDDHIIVNFLMKRVLPIALAILLAIGAGDIILHHTPSTRTVRQLPESHGFTRVKSAGTFGNLRCTVYELRRNGAPDSLTYAHRLRDEKNLQHGLDLLKEELTLYYGDPVGEADFGRAIKLRLGDVFRSIDADKAQYWTDPDTGSTACLYTAKEKLYTGKTVTNVCVSFVPAPTP